MSGSNSVARALHDVGLAAWFGGSLMGAVGLNGASEDVADPKDRIRVADAGWGRWAPVNLVAIVAHLVGAAKLLRANTARLAGQQHVGSLALAKGIVTAAALVATMAARVAGQKVMDAEAEAARASLAQRESGEQEAAMPAPHTADEVVAAQKKLRILQWMVPLLTGSALVISSRMGEQQRPHEVASGLLRRLRPGR